MKLRELPDFCWHSGERIETEFELSKIFETAEFFWEAEHEKCPTIHACVGRHMLLEMSSYTLSFFCEGRILTKIWPVVLSVCKGRDQTVIVGRFKDAVEPLWSLNYVLRLYVAESGSFVIAE